jgi:hypothetical protein
MAATQNLEEIMKELNKVSPILAELYEEFLQNKKENHLNDDPLESI